MPVVMEMILLFLFFGGYSASLEASTPMNSPFTLVTSSSEAPNLNTMASNYTSRVPEKNDSTGHQIIPPSSTPYAANEVSSPETSVAASSGLSIAGPTISQEISTEKPSVPQEISNVNSNPTPPAINTLGFHNMTGGTTATGTLETSNGTSGPPITMATSSQGSSNETSGLPITMETSSQESSNRTSGLPITMATSSLATSDRTSGPPITIAPSYLETSNGTSVLPGTMATSSLETPKETSGSPTPWETTPITTTPKASTNTDSGPSVSPDQKTNNTLIMAVLVALLVVIVLLALLLLWRQRQKRRTGALTLSRGGKRNGVVDAWAGPAQVSDEEAVITTAGGSGGDKGSGIPEGEGSGRRPTLTTFFGRRKSRQGSLALEELKAGSTSSLKGEEEPLVGGENGAVEAADSDGPEVGDVQVP
ncbi:leukosialin [Phyllostomus hastatus]|uniref:leukosialin n=1 Tax=Phyllostomus hastatus TaxID=9423 RepID=UPI001E67E03E|nr:leukosialin [Phyllostomus hastatus]XP_045705002.1 leukosialin [Phyllostomus hastatus]